ncbi:MAG: histidine kinase [Rhodocyclaceae bacterium]|nr:histidine kinase [Rhodocyclaceae bacterium]
MTTSVYQEIRQGLQSGFSQATDFLARLSFWRFVGLCILLLIAANMVGNLFEKSKPQHPVVKVLKKTPPPPPEPPQPLESAAPSIVPPVGADNTPSKDQTTKESDSKAKPRDVEIKIGQDGVVIKGSADLERLGNKIEQEINKAEQRRINAGHPVDDEDETIEIAPPASRVSLPQIVLLLILVMFIIRFVANSKLRAEAKAAVAIEAADHATLKQQLAEARLQALQAQVEPHFLFNTLAAVEHLIETDPPRAAKMQGNLIGYLRSVMPNLRKPDSTVGREVDICRHYLEILKVRMEDRLDIVIDVPPGLESASLPPLILQSLVENAIQHGLEPKAEGGQIKIKAEISDGHLVIIVADTGIGFSPKSATSGGGVGISNIRERLAAMFDKRGQLIITPNAPCGTQVRIELPYSVSDLPVSRNA